MLKAFNENFNPHSIELKIPTELIELPEDLKIVDQILEDERFIKPFVEMFNTKRGRPTIPVEVYIRMMYLKHRFSLSYESVEREVSDSIKWRIFCHLTFEDKVPDSTTLVKLTKKYGRVIDELNELLTQAAREKKIIRWKKLRADTTVIGAPISHPLDSKLLFDGIKVITRGVEKIKKLGFNVKFRDFTRSSKKKMIRIVKILKKKGKEGKEEVKREVSSLLNVAKKVVKESCKVLYKVGMGARRSSDDVRKKFSIVRKELRMRIKIVKKVIEQTEEVLRGCKPHRRLVSIFEPGARAIVRGKLFSKVEFGWKVLIQECGGFITGYKVLDEPVSDKKLVRGIMRGHIKSFGSAPDSISLDRGFYSEENERYLRRRVRRVMMKKKGGIDKERRSYEGEKWFRRLSRYRSGIEGKISLLKRRYGMRRSKNRGRVGCEGCVGIGIMVHNLWYMVEKMK